MTETLAGVSDSPQWQLEPGLRCRFIGRSDVSVLRPVIIDRVTDREVITNSGACWWKPDFVRCHRLWGPADDAEVAANVGAGRGAGK